MKNKTNNHRLFSKALFKQSCKANGLMWGIITLAVCFTLACVMLISGTSNISAVKSGVQDTIIEEIIKSEIKKASVNLYCSSNDAEIVFDDAFKEKFDELNTKENAEEIAKIKLLAQANATALVTENVTEKVTAEVTKRITDEISLRVQNETEEIKSEVQSKVMEDLASQEGQEKIQAKIDLGMTEEAATTLVAAEYKTIETKNVTDAHILKAQQELTTDEHKTKVKNAVLAEKGAEYKETAMNELSSNLKEIEDEATKEVTDKIKEVYITPAYLYAVDKVSAKYPDSGDTKTKYGAAMVTINPNNKVDSKYEENHEEVPAEYINAFIPYITKDIESYESSDTPTHTLSEYVTSKERCDFRSNRAYKACSMLISAKITSLDYKQEILDILKDYKVDEEKYDSMGFDYSNTYNISYEAMIEYQAKYDYEVSLLSDDVVNNSEEYAKQIKVIEDNLYTTVAGSLLDKLPESVSDGIEELGTMDLYGLIVGSIFFKMAGLLLPIIYVIMVSNNLVAGQVDNGSMAYVLSTSTRRKEVTFTQAIYLIGSLFLMFVCTTITSIICFAVANVNTDLTYAKLIFINIGAFFVLFAISGINYLTSCYFDRSKRAMALGGGVSIFFLVATMLGLFGSSVIPSVVRISALNNFNYASIISLFNVVSILRGEYTWIWEVAILIGIGLVGYILGAIKFEKKDLPL